MSGAETTSAAAWRRSLDVRLEIYEGPLDLLLYLIRKSDLDIHDIPIAKITKEYIEFLDVMKELNLEIAGEFLVMASTLMQIKARMLLPSHAPEEGEEEGVDPRDELVRRLIEYQSFKTASSHLRDRLQEAAKTHFRGEPVFESEDKSLRVEVFDLVKAMKRVLDRIEDTHVEIEGEQFPVEDRIRRILELLEGQDYVPLESVFEGETKRLGVVICFLALLELIKIRKVFARQDENLGEIRIFKKQEPGEAAMAQPEADAVDGEAASDPGGLEAET